MIMASNTYDGEEIKLTTLNTVKVQTPDRKTTSNAKVVWFMDDSMFLPEMIFPRWQTREAITAYVNRLDNFSGVDEMDLRMYVSGSWFWKQVGYNYTKWDVDFAPEKNQYFCYSNVIDYSDGDEAVNPLVFFIENPNKTSSELRDYISSETYLLANDSGFVHATDQIRNETLWFLPCPFIDHYTAYSVLGEYTLDNIDESRRTGVTLLQSDGNTWATVRAPEYGVGIIYFLNKDETQTSWTVDITTIDDEVEGSYRYAVVTRYDGGYSSQSDWFDNLEWQETDYAGSWTMELEVNQCGLIILQTDASFDPGYQGWFDVQVY